MTVTDRPVRARRPRLGGMFAPGAETPSRVSGPAWAFVRVLAGLLWLYNVAWKRPPDFGQDHGNSVYGFTRDAVDHPVFAPYSWVVEHLVLPHFTLFGWSVLVVESLLAVLLLTGTMTRLAALLGVAQSLAIGLSVANTPGEWPWSYWLMIGVHVALLVSPSSQFAAVDAVRAEAAGSPARHGSASRLLGGWGVVVGLTGLWALIVSIGEDPFASTGSQLGGSALSVSLGSYNLAGAVVLLATAALLVVAAMSRRAVFALAAAAVGALAALSLYAQLSRTDVWLGGSNTSAAYFLCPVLLAVVMARVLAEPAGRVATTGDTQA